MSSFSLKDGLVIAGRYQVLQPLGHGAHGAVYEAVRVEDGARVAVKVMHERHLDTTDARRFEREWALVQRLNGPHVIRIFDFGHDDMLPFIAFERLRGLTLAEELEANGPLGVERTARVSRQVLIALSEAHDLNIVHRDIKPANIFLCEGRGDFVKVLDFGTAKALGEEAGAGLTATGQMLGTAQYMAPEQVRGASQVTPRADLYSLGTLMAEMLTGEKLVSGVNAIDVFMQHISDDPLEIPAAIMATPLGPVVQRAVEKNLERRYASATEMIQAIDDAIEGAQTAAKDHAEDEIARESVTEKLATAQKGPAVQEPETPNVAVLLRPPTAVRRRRRRWPLLLFAAAALVAGGAAAWRLFGAKLRSAPAQTGQGKIAGLDAERLRAALVARGLTVREHTRSSQPGVLELVSFELTEGTRVGYAELYRWHDDEQAERGAKSLPQTRAGTAMLREGRVALVIVHPDGDAAALLARLVE